MFALHRGEHDDPALLLRDHLRREGANCVGGAVQVVVDNVAPVRVFHLEKWLPALNRGVRDHDVDFTIGLLHHVGDARERSDIANVGAHGLAAPAICRDLAHRLIQFRGRRRGRIGGGGNRPSNVERDDIGAVGGEFDRDHSADAARSAGDHCDLARKIGVPPGRDRPGAAFVKEAENERLSFRIDGPRLTAIW